MTSSKPGQMPETHHPRFFTFALPERFLFVSWFRYKLKECWTLVLCLWLMRGKTGPVLVHNWNDPRSLEFSKEFLAQRAVAADTRLLDAELLEPHAGSFTGKVWALFPAMLLLVLPVQAIISLVRLILPGGEAPLVVYCDGHLSGFILVKAAADRTTATLQHGLYRVEGSDSIMGLQNFAADKIYLWDRATEQEFLDAGIAQDRLLRTGQYGFGTLSDQTTQSTELAVLCPPFDTSYIEAFQALASQLPETMKAAWSLHPRLRAQFENLEQRVLATADPRPAVAICGDSGVIMDSLVRGIPVVSVANRSLTTAHIPLSRAAKVKREELVQLFKSARAGLTRDRENFGFETGPAQCSPQKPDGQLHGGVDAKA